MQPLETGNRLYVAVRVVLLAAGGLLAADAALAQGSAAGQSGVLEEIVVTARQRSESLIEVPVAVSSINAETLQDYGTTDIRDLSRMAPSLNIDRASSGAGGVLALRGIGTSPGQAGFDQAVSINIDGVQTGRARVLTQGLFDIEQVDVLKGPQALFFGKNSPAGVISIRSAGPTREFSGYARAGYEFGADEALIEGAIAGPLSDAWAARLAVRYRNMKGWLRNDAALTSVPFSPPDPGVPVPGVRRPGEKELMGRMTLAFTPPDSDFDATLKLAASDYEVRFSTPPAGQVVRLSDGTATAFTDLTDLASKQIDGLTFNVTTAGNAGERILFKPFATTAANVKALVYAPSELAAANAINAAMGTSNAGSLQLAGLKATGLPALTTPAVGTPVTLTFNGSGGFTVANSVGTPMDISTTPPTPITPTNPGPPPVYGYTSGQAINIDGWQITLQGTPLNGDTVNVGNARDPKYGDAYTRNAGNAGALMNLRDVQMFDNATLQDGWANAMSNVGTRTQSAQYAANMSTSIADSLESQRVAVSGVNLDEEAARLIQYQQAYQASAKMLQIAQSIFDSLLQTVSR